MSAHKRVQVNLYVESGSSAFNLWHTSFTKGVYYPLLSVDQTGEITEEVAKDFKTQVLDKIRQMAVAFLALLIIGIFLLVIGTVVAIVAKLRGSTTRVQKVEEY